MTVIAVGDDAAHARVETGGRTSGQPGVHLSSTVVRLTTPTDEDLVLAETMATAGVEFIAVSFVCTAADVGACRRGRRDTGAAGLEDRDPGGARRPRRDHRGVRRADGRPWRPRDRLPDRGRAASAEADHPRLRRGGQAGDHRDADARVDDHGTVADPRRGQRRRQRRVRRHRRRHAVRRDRDRSRPGRRGANDGDRRRPRRIRGELPAVGDQVGPNATRAARRRRRRAIGSRWR